MLASGHYMICMTLCKHAKDYSFFNICNGQLWFCLPCKSETEMVNKNTE